jgi:hypothetical protein
MIVSGKYLHGSKTHFQRSFPDGTVGKRGRGPSIRAKGARFQSLKMPYKGCRPRRYLVDEGGRCLRERHPF